MRGREALRVPAVRVPLDRGVQGYDLPAEARVQRDEVRDGHRAQADGQRCGAAQVHRAAQVRRLSRGPLPTHLLRRPLPGVHASFPPQHLETSTDLHIPSPFPPATFFWATWARAQTADQWLAGSDLPPKLCSLDPADGGKEVANEVKVEAAAVVKSRAVVEEELAAALARVELLEKALAAAGVAVPPS